MTDLTCDVAVIGAGTAGLAAERSARKAGATTLLIDPAFNGTTCATVGCMPSKLLIAAARTAHEARNAGALGIRTQVDIDGPAVMRRLRALRDDFVSATRAGIDRLPDGVRITGRAHFTGPDRLALGDGRSIRAGAIVIATGSSPMIPPPYRDLPHHLLTNETIFELRDLPKSLAVVGAGPIGLELAQAMARLGVRVALFDHSDRLGGVRCDDVHDALKRTLARDMDLHLGSDPAPSVQDGTLRIDWGTGAETFDKVLVATGRPPDIAGLNLAATGLALNDRGMPDIDPESLQCGDAAIFVAGDANAVRPLLHEASDEGATAGRNAVSYPAVSRPDREVPLAITFTDPPLVTVGAAPTRSDAIGRADYTNQGRARVENRNVGLARIYAAAPGGRLTGADLFCPGADHMGHLLALAIGRGLSATDLLALPIYHPTLEEGLKPALRDICKAVPLKIPADRDTRTPPGA
ncbi:dihydrolipoamide dehydrogenase [Salipiger aestuarii]|uniref:Dihydrolipoamide dehydrogenase n=1 Tax=Salipiger aestuarii TaxID=568098 RepID=A0A327Y1W3_9RHOB|nr:dihydrolipoyl dehydrogenase [Salipiger aestuarii]KAB2540848.1 dihydrolipoamide dehydrogenase [Salipiger aestuarii]RAK12369.1 dihydrolipoamide dehydrogenase [Salipiger aestuarii]